MRNLRSDYDNEGSSGFVTFLLIVIPLIAGGVGFYFWYHHYKKQKPAMDAFMDNQIHEYTRRHADNTSFSQHVTPDSMNVIALTPPHEGIKNKPIMEYKV